MAVAFNRDIRLALVGGSETAAEGERVGKKVEEALQRVDAGAAAASRSLEQIGDAAGRGGTEAVQQLGGAGQQARAIVIQLERVNAGAASAARSLERVGNAAEHSGSGALSRLGGVAQQIQDVAVQWQAGTAGAVIFAQQGPQILSAFGPVGAVLGGVAAVVAVLAGAWLSAADDEQSASQIADEHKRVLELTSGTIAAQTETVGQLAAKYRELSQEQRAAEQAELEAGIRRATRALQEQLEQAAKLKQAFAGKYPDAPLPDTALPPSLFGAVNPQFEAFRQRTSEIREAMDRLGDNPAPEAIERLFSDLNQLRRRDDVAKDVLDPLIERLIDIRTEAEPTRRKVEELRRELDTLAQVAAGKQPTLDPSTPLRPDGKHGAGSGSGRTPADEIAQLEARLKAVRDPVGGAVDQLRASTTWQQATAEERKRLEELTASLVRTRGEVKGLAKDQQDAARDQKADQALLTRARLQNDRGDGGAAARQASIESWTSRLSRDDKGQVRNPLIEAQLRSEAAATYDAAQAERQLQQAYQERKQAADALAQSMRPYLTQLEQATAALRDFDAQMQRAGPAGDPREQELRARTRQGLERNKAYAEGNPWEGSRRGLQGFIDQYGNAAQAMQQITGNLAEGFASTVSGMFQGAEVSAEEATANILRMISDILIRLAIARAIGAAMGFFDSGAAASAGGGASASESGLMGGGLAGTGMFGSGEVEIRHAGGTVGLGGTTRNLPTVAWIGAPRLHDGSGSVAARMPAQANDDQEPVVLQTGERLLRREELAALQRAGITSTAELARLGTPVPAAAGRVPGLATDEVAAVLRRGDRVFSRAEVARARRYHAGGLVGLDPAPPLPQPVPMPVASSRTSADASGDRQGSGLGQLTVHVDARGASDPAMMEAMIRRVVPLAVQTVADRAQRDPSFRRRLQSR